ncbi:polysaccharide deacetylase [Methyloligella sp. 2.7D]|uniref:polysaccharide deacetylase family protein n=1 Tax=unclassified Methyloligella TaxID=2625955 RepID=UPI00157DF75C|nr:polysaccharide deacetylase [Methyloligella sp. GL2]QKP77925.1 polysaccharide deacetylase [Methyloligella sp. GL2]
MIHNPPPWPNGARCAAAFTFDIDTDSLVHLFYRDRAPDMVATTSWCRYDEVAVPRILELYRRLGLKQSFYYPAWCMENYPELVEAILKDGHEIGHHGYIHENYNVLPAEEEEKWFVRALEVHKSMTGQAPRGFRAPTYNFSRHTAALLVKYGFQYDASLMTDDFPHMVDAEGGSFVEIPTHWALDDWPQYVHAPDFGYQMTVRSPAEACAVYRAEFEATYRLGGLWVGIWHPWVSARPARLDAIAEMMEEMISRGDVWIASMEEIAAHLQQLEKDGIYEPRRIRLPYYDKGLPDDLLPSKA